MIDASVYSWITIVSGVLLVILVLMQKRGTDLGAAFGGGNSLHVERRGVEKSIFQFTILTAIVFVLSIVIVIFQG